MGWKKLSGFHLGVESMKAQAVRKLEGFVSFKGELAPAWFVLAPEGSHCDCCESGVWKALKYVDSMPASPAQKLSVKMYALTRVQAPAGLAKLYHDHCEGDKLNHKEGKI